MATETYTEVARRWIIRHERIESLKKQADDIENELALTAAQQAEDEKHLRTGVGRNMRSKAYGPFNYREKLVVVSVQYSESANIADAGYIGVELVPLEEEKK